MTLHPATFAILKTWSSGDILTAADLNGNFSQILTNLNPGGVADDSPDVATMRLTVDPYPASVESLATSLEGELQRIRFELKQLKGTTYWYQPSPATGGIALTSTALAIPVADNNGSLTGWGVSPTGSILQYGGLTEPTGYFFCNGATKSRTTNSVLFGIITKSSTVTIDIATPALIHWSTHGLVAGDVVSFETTGALPTGLSVGTNYYVIAAGLTADVFEVATTFMRSAIVTITIASPAVITWNNHGFNANDQITFSTTGALPTGLTAGTTYYVISAGLTANTFEVSTSQGGSAVNTSGSQSGNQTCSVIAVNTSGAQNGVQTARNNPFGCGDGSTTFALPDFRRRVAIGKGGSIVNAAMGNALGDAYGEEQHLLLSGESGVPTHTHAEQINTGSSGGTTGIADSHGTALTQSTAAVGTYPAGTTSANTAADAASAHNIMQPSLVVNFIIKF